MPRNRGRGRGGGSNRRGRSATSSRSGQTNRHYPRTARLNTLLQQIVADHLERVDDERLGFLTVTGVEVDNDLNRAQVFISTLNSGPSATEPDPEADAAYLEILEEYRKPIQAQIGSEARIRKTPEISFAFDPGVRAGARIEEILSGLDLPSDDDEGSEQPDEPGDPAEGGGDPSPGPEAGA